MVRGVLLISPFHQGSSVLCCPHFHSANLRYSIMKRCPHLILLLISGDAFNSSPTAIRPKTILHNSISGNEKRTFRQSIAPLSPNTGAVGSPGPISNTYRRTSSSPKRVPDRTSVRNEKRPKKNASINNQHQQPPPDESLQQEVTRLKQILKERDDDVETLIYEIYRLQELSSKAKDANDARSSDFTFLKKEAERLKADFEERTRKNEEKMKTLMGTLKDREEKITRLEEQLNASTTAIDDLQMQINGMASPSLGTSPDRIPQRQYRATKSYQQVKNVAVVGGAPILYRPQTPKETSSRDVASMSDDHSANVFSEGNPGEQQIILEAEHSMIDDDTSKSQDFDSKLNDTCDDTVARQYGKPNGIGVGNMGMLQEKR